MKTFVTISSGAVLLFAFWLLLSAGDLASLMIGLPAIAMAILLIPRLSNPETGKRSTVNVVALFQFAYFFIIESLRGGVDVSRRVLRKKINIAPVFFDYSMRLQQAGAQQLFISSISLLPGTLCAGQNKTRLLVHSLDQQTHTLPGIQRLENLVSKIYGEKP